MLQQRCNRDAGSGERMSPTTCCPSRRWRPCSDLACPCATPCASWRVSPPPPMLLHPPPFLPLLIRRMRPRLQALRLAVRRRKAAVCCSAATWSGRRTASGCAAQRPHAAVSSRCLRAAITAGAVSPPPPPPSPAPDACCPYRLCGLVMCDACAPLRLRVGEHRDVRCCADCLKAAAAADA